MGPPMTAEHGIKGSDVHPVCLALTCVAPVLAALVLGVSAIVAMCPGTGRTSARSGRVCNACPGIRTDTARGQTCSFNFHCKHSRVASPRAPAVLVRCNRWTDFVRGRRVEPLPRIDIPPFNTAPEIGVFGCLLPHTSPFPFYAPVRLVLCSLL